MSRFPAVFACVFAVASAPAVAWAQAAPDAGSAAPAAAPAAAAPAATASDASAPAAPAATPPPDKPATPFVGLPMPPPAHPPISSTTSAMLDAGRPAYNPPKPVVQKPEDDLPDLRDVDKPKNGIIRLPKYVVRAPKSPVFRDQDFYSKDQLANLAMQRYAGLNFGPLSDLNKPIAVQMFNDDVRQQNISDLNDAAASSARGGDAAEGEYIKRLSDDTYSRSFDMGGMLPMQRPSQ